MDIKWRKKLRVIFNGRSEGFTCRRVGPSILLTEIQTRCSYKDTEKYYLFFLLKRLKNLNSLFKNLKKKQNMTSCEHIDNFTYVIKYICVKGRKSS
jgi:hypothetical protein